MTGTPGTSGPEQPVADPRDYVQDGLILIGCSKPGRDLTAECIELALANRHGLVTGATGTGKTVTLQVLAEGFSAAGVPVFAADIKGDLSGIAAEGQAEAEAGRARRGDRLDALRQYILSDGVLGHFRRGRPSGARNRAGDGTAAALAPDGADRAAGRRAQHRLPLGRGRARSRRRQDVDPRSQGSALRHRRDGQARREPQKQIRQRRARDRRRHSAPPAGAGRAGRRQVLRRAGARHHGFPEASRRTGAASSTFSPPRS